MSGYPALRSRFFGRSFLPPHFRHFTASTGFRALHRMQMLFSSSRSSASGNRAMGDEGVLWGLTLVISGAAGPRWRRRPKG